MMNSHSEPQTWNRTRVGRNEVPRRGNECGSVGNDRAWNPPRPPRPPGREIRAAEGGTEVKGPNLEHEAALGHSAD